MFDQLKEELEMAIDEVVDAQSNLQYELDQAEAELMAASDFHKEQVLNRPGADHSEMEENINALEAKVVRLRKRRNAFPQGFPSRESVAARIAAGQSNGLMQKAVQCLEAAKEEIDQQQAIIQQGMTVTLPKLREDALCAANEIGLCEKRKAEIVQAMNFIKSCCPKHPLARFRARPAIEWGKLEMFDDAISSEYDAARK